MVVEWYAFVTRSYIKPVKSLDYLATTNHVFLLNKEMSGLFKCAYVKENDGLALTGPLDQEPQKPCW